MKFVLREAQTLIDYAEVTFSAFVRYHKWLQLLEGRIANLWLSVPII